MSYKTTEELMSHLRERGITISGSIQKRQLMNEGYFHGYKGYRFFKNTANRIPFTSYDEVHATIQYDSRLKALFYEKLMFIETAVKNITLEGILTAADSESIQVMFDHVISGYHNAPATFTSEQRQRLQQNKLNLQKSIQSNLANAYEKNNPKIVHFYNNASYAEVPLWALFEIMTMGDFGYLLSCLIYDVRDNISKRIGLNLASDTNRQLIYKYIYTLKDLRNAVAHNAVVFDTRFRNIDPTKSMKQCLENEIGLPYVNFETIGDYVILICYYLKLLEIPKEDIEIFVANFQNETETYRTSVDVKVADLVIHSDLKQRIKILEKYI